MAILLDDNMKEQITKRCQRGLDVDKMTPTARENYYKKIRQEIEEDEKWLAENDHTGVDWDAPSEGWYTIGKTEFAEDEYDPSISPEAEEKLIRESEENSVDTGYLTKDEFDNLFEMEDEEYEKLVKRSKEGDRISQELFGTVGSENLSRKQIDKVRAKLGLDKLWYD